MGDSERVRSFLEKLRALDFAASRILRCVMVATLTLCENALAYSV